MPKIFPVKKRTFFFLFVFVAAFAFGLLLRPASPKQLSEARLLMGTIVDVQTPANHPLAKQALQACFLRMQEVDAFFKDGAGAAQALSSTACLWSEQQLLQLPEQLSDIEARWLSTLLEVGLPLEKRSQGAYHLGSLKLIQCWNFAEASMPPAASHRLQSLQALCKPSERRLEDWSFSSLAKGLAVDEGLELLKSYGLESALINAGGDIAAFGSAYQVGVQHPRIAGTLLAQLSLKDAALATSGDYECCFFYEGQRFHHLLDARSGEAIQGVQSVTIQAPSCLMADACATAFSLMEKDQAMAWVTEAEGLEVLWVNAEGRSFQSKALGELKETI
jgi:FAD:protein FMN transferase